MANIYSKLTSPTVQIWVSWIIIIGSLIGWPVSAITVAKEEPAVILAISWLALVFSGYSGLVSALGNKRIEEK